MYSGSKVATWIDRLGRAFAEKRGHRIGKLLNPELVFEAIGSNEIQITQLSTFETYTNRLTKGPFKYSGGTLKSVIVPLFKIIMEMASSSLNYSSIVGHAINALNTWIDLYRSLEARPFNWMVPGLVTLLTFLDVAGGKADNQQESSMLDIGDNDNGEDKGGADALQQTQHQQRVLNAIRQHIGKFRGDDNRQAGYVVLMSESIQACMSLGNIQMASAFLKTVESSTLHVAKIPREPLVSFKYFLGKLYMQQDKFQKAEESLAWSFANCPNTKETLRRQIAECLVAVRLRMGKLPSLALIQKFELHHYAEIVKAMKSGDIRRFEIILTKETKHFIEEGTLLCVEKLKFIVYRTLFQRILDWAKKSFFLPGKPTNVIPIDIFTAGFKWQMEDTGIEFDHEEMSCIIANLIKLGYVKGYIAWEHGKVVLSKQTPLPPLQSIQVV